MGTPPRHPSRLTTVGLLAQGGYYLVSGVWPLVSIGTFQAVTGPKTDRWLVKTIGLLVSVIGAVLVGAGARRAVGPEMWLLAGGSAASLAAIDVIYVARGRIARVYLLDAFIELALLVLLGLGMARHRAGRESAPAGSGGQSPPS